MKPKSGRPITPEGYGIPREGSGADVLPWSRVEEWLEKSRNYWIASTRPDGRPHAIPVWGVWLDGAVIFSTSRDSTKGRNLALRPQVVMHLESGDEVVIIESEVEETDDVDLLTRYADAYEKKYNFRPEPVNSPDATYLVRPKVVLSWMESDFINSATRWTFDEA